MVIIKFLWGLLINLDLLAILILLISCVMLFRSHCNRGKLPLIFSIFILSVIHLTPVLHVGVQWLEKQYPLPSQSEVEKAEGFILLGGFFDLFKTRASQKPYFNLAAARLMDFIKIVKKYPHKKILLTGTPEEITWTLHYLEGFDIPKENIIIENQSQTTMDNAQKIADLKVDKTKPWVLMTSALHMLRSVKLFAYAGWKNTIPYPVDYHSIGSNYIQILSREGSIGWAVFMKEIAALTNLYLEGKASKIF